MIVCPVTLLNVSGKFMRKRSVSSLSISALYRTGRTNSSNGTIGSLLAHMTGPDISCRLGRDRVGVMVGDKDKQTILQFVNSWAQLTAVQPLILSVAWLRFRRIHHVLIIGYERLRTVMWVSRPNQPFHTNNLSVLICNTACKHPSKCRLILAYGNQPTDRSHNMRRR